LEVRLNQHIHNGTIHSYNSIYKFKLYIKINNNVF